MLPTAHLTSHSRMSGSRWVTTPLWSSESLRNTQFFCVFLPPLLNILKLLISLLLVISVLYCTHLCMRCPLGIFTFLEKISGLSHSIVFLYFFSLLTQEGFLISPCFSLELCIQLGISFPFSFAFHISSFLGFCKASSDNHFAFLHFFFLGIILVTTSYTMLWTSVHSFSRTLSTRSNPLNLFVTSTMWRDLI